MHVGVTLFSSFICMAILVWPDVGCQESLIVWVACVAGTWVWIGAALGVVGGIVCSLAGVALWPLLLAKLSCHSRRFFWVAISLNLLIVLASMCIAKGKLESGLFM
jgi:hypothetical protein